MSDQQDEARVNAAEPEAKELSDEELDAVSGGNEAALSETNLQGS
jgi:bacteriocin-like protein